MKTWLFYSQVWTKANIARLFREDCFRYVALARRAHDKCDANPPSKVNVVETVGPDGGTYPGGSRRSGSVVKVGDDPVF